MTHIKLKNISIDYPLIELNRSIKKTLFKNASKNFLKHSEKENMLFYRAIIN